MEALVGANAEVSRTAKYRRNVLQRGRGMRAPDPVALLIWHCECIVMAIRNSLTHNTTKASTTNTLRMARLSTHAASQAWTAVILHDGAVSTACWCLSRRRITVTSPSLMSIYVTSDEEDYTSHDCTDGAGGQVVGNMQDQWAQVHFADMFLHLSLRIRDMLRAGTGMANEQSLGARVCCVCAAHEGHLRERAVDLQSHSQFLT